MPEEATDRMDTPSAFHLEKMVVNKKVFPVPPGASTKSTRPCLAFSCNCLSRIS